MSPSDIEVGKTYHNGKGRARKVILIGNHYCGDAEIYYKPVGASVWLHITLKSFAKWAKGEIKPIPKIVYCNDCEIEEVVDQDKPNSCPFCESKNVRVDGRESIPKEDTNAR
jgi:hypothetical protein